MSFSAEEELKFEVFKNKELENQLAQQKALLDEAVKVIENSLHGYPYMDAARVFLEKEKKR